MKKFFAVALLILCLGLLFPINGSALDFSDWVPSLDATTAPATTDVVPIITDPTSTKVPKQIAVKDLGKRSTVNNLGTFLAPITTASYNLAAEDSYGSILWYGATNTVNLPTAVAGMSVDIYNTGAFTITINPQDADIVVRDGTSQSAGVSFTLSTGAGNFVVLVSDAAGHWVTQGFKGTLSAGS